MKPSPDTATRAPQGDRHGGVRFAHWCSSLGQTVRDSAGVARWLARCRLCRRSRAKGWALMCAGRVSSQLKSGESHGREQPEPPKPDITRMVAVTFMCSNLASSLSFNQLERCLQIDHSNLLDKTRYKSPGPTRCGRSTAQTGTGREHRHQWSDAAIPRGSHHCGCRSGAYDGWQRRCGRGQW
jgi:hypothetical protein